MFRTVPFVFLILSAGGWCALADESGDELAAARRHLLRGRYEEASDLFQKLVNDTERSGRAAIGLSRCHEAVGKWDEAVQVIDRHIEKAGDDADAWARRAELAFRRGNLETARDACRKALELNPNQLAARWTTVQLHAASGDFDGVQQGCAWFVDRHNKAELKDPESLAIIGQAAIEYAARTLRGREQSDQLSAILNNILDGAAQVDPDFWIAPYLSGNLFLEKHRKGDAITDLQRALSINPSAAPIHVAIGEASLDDYEFEAGHQHADRAIAINAHLPAARRLKADLFMGREQFPDAIEQLELALQINPVDEETLGRLAACHWLTRNHVEYQRLSDEVLKRNPRPAIYHARLAERIEDHRRFDQAEQSYLKAVEADPNRPETYGHLGMLYMRIGKGEQAAKTLDRAFEMDPFNARVKNMLEVLDQLRGYATIETEHFRIKVDGELDAMLGRYAAKYLEEVFTELSGHFGYQPPDRIQIEIFNKGRGESAHRWFSARTIGLPWIGTVGACTGKVVAMASPTGMQRPFNWARVLKHEVVHVITLQQTNFNIPHWFTEALAVTAEDYPRPQMWNELLASRVPAGNLFDLDNINLAFARPRSQLDWHMAYCQSELYAEYMQKRFGTDSTARLLDAYREGLSTSEAIPKLFGVTTANFEEQYVQFLQETTAGMKALAVERPMTRQELELAVKQEPTNADLIARLAAEHLKQRNYPLVRSLANRTVAIEKHHPMGNYLLARLHMVTGDAERARELLEPAMNFDNPNAQVMELLADLWIRAKEYERAKSIYELGLKRFPADSKWVAGMARVALITDNRPALRQALEQLSQLDADDLSPRKKLAQMALEDQDWPAAARFAWMTLHIHVSDLEAHQILAEAMAGQQNWAEAAEEYRAIMELRPGDPAAHWKLIKALDAAGDRDAAVMALKEFVTKEPKNSEARELLDQWLR